LLYQSDEHSYALNVSLISKLFKQNGRTIGEICHAVINQVLRLSSRRTVADVFLPDGTNVNQELVKNGWCSWYRKYVPGDPELERLEQDAREARKGLWDDPAPDTTVGVAETEVKRLSMPPARH
jgi:hypothetical protein